MRISSFSTATSRRAQGRSTLTREASSQGGTTLRAHIVPAALLAFVGATFVGATGARAGFVNDDNRGSFRVDLRGNALGLEPPGLPFSENTVQDTRAGTVALTGTSGRLTTIGFEPLSTTGWREVIINATANARADLKVSLLQCDGAATPIPGFTNLIPLAGRVDISAIDVEAVPCLLSVHTAQFHLASAVDGGKGRGARCGEGSRAGGRPSSAAVSAAMTPLAPELLTITSSRPRGRQFFR